MVQAVAVGCPGATMEGLGRVAVWKGLEAGGGSTTRTAQILGMRLRKMQYRLHEYGVARPRGSVSPSTHHGVDEDEVAPRDVA